MKGSTSIALDVAILGGGFTGVYCAKTLCKQLGRGSKLRIGLISEFNYMVFQPMLPEVVGASVSPRHVVNPLRLLCRGVEVFKGVVERIRWHERRLTLHAGDFAGDVEISFEHLVLALGAVIDLSHIPGMPEHAFLMQNVGDAMLLRAAILGRFEEANLESRPDVKRRLLTFVVVGGGYSGVETAGQILDLFGAIHGYYPNVSRHDLQVYLIHSRDHLLPTLSRRLGEYSAERLRKRGLTLVLNERVKSITAHEVHLQSGGTIEANMVISTVGNAPHPLVTALCDENQFPVEKGRILSESTGRVRGQTHVWAGGDCAAVPYAQGGFCPDTAQFAMRQGVLVGKNIARAYRGEPLRPFMFKSLGQIATIGHHTAVASIKGFGFSGLFAWWFWRTVYLAKLPGFDRKLRVVIDWTLELFFPRDINLLSPRFTKVLKEIYLESGGVLFRKGEPAFSLYIVKSGSVEVSDEHGVVQTIGPGEHFGERALLNDRVWHFDGRAKEPSVLVSVPASAFHQIVSGSGSLGRLFQKSAARYQSRAIIRKIAERMPAHVLGRHAGDIMQRNIHTVRPTMSVRETVEVTRAYPHSAYPVIDQEGRILGVMQREDFYEFLKSERTAAETCLKQMSFTALPVVQVNATVADVLEKIVRSGASKVLVADEAARLQGMITMIDLIAGDSCSTR
jgi:NADH dehydrogenase